jgi:hypothetical protein
LRHIIAVFASYQCEAQKQAASGRLKLRRNTKMTAILKMMMKGFLMSLVVFGLLAVTANAQKGAKKFAYKLDKQKIKFTTPAFELPAGKIVVSGDVKGIDVSGGSGGCFTITVTTYRFTPNGEKVPVRSRSKQICMTDRLPEVVVDRIPRGKYLVEVEIDRPLLRDESLNGELTVRLESERVGLQ